MRRPVRALLPLLMGIALLATGVVAQAQPAESKDKSPKSGGGTGTAAASIPGYEHLFFVDRVQRQLKLTDAQKKQVSEIGRKWLTEFRQRRDALLKPRPGVAAQTRSEYLEEEAKRAQQARKEVDAILSPEQLTQLKEILFRAYVGDIWMNRLGTADQFAPAVSEDQNAQLLKIRGEYREKVLKFREDREKISSLGQERVDNALKVFTPEQQTKLREMAEMWTGSAPNSRGGVGVAAQPRMPRPIPYWGEATFQRELRVTQEQEPKLDVILRDYVKDTSLLRRTMTPGAPREQNIEAQKEILRLAQEARKQVEAVLSPEQVAKLNEIEFREYFRTHSPGWTRMGPSWDGPGLNEDQKREFSKLLDDLHDKTSKLRQETVDNVLKVLTPEQQKKLREMMEMSNGLRPESGGGVGVAAQPRMSRPITYWGEATFQRELRVTQEQEPKLVAIVRNYAKVTSLLRMSTTAGAPREQNIEAQKEIARLAQEAWKQAEAVLSAEQVTKLNAIEFREYALSRSQIWLRMPPGRDGLGVNEDQKREFRNLFDELENKVSKLHQETVDRALKVLTPEQQKKLRELQAAEPRF